VLAEEPLPEAGPAEGDQQKLLAFRYVAGEMTPEEARAFEARMADDQEAREALTQAVALAQRLVEASPAAPERVAWSGAAVGSAVRGRHAAPRAAAVRAAAKPVGWMAAGAAAALLIASMLGWPARPTIETTPEPGGSQDGGSRHMADALVWARLQARSDGSTAELENWLDEPAAVDKEEGNWPTSTELPSWVFAATQSLQKSRPQKSRPQK
jgi:hypothetical protein